MRTDPEGYHVGGLGLWGYCRDECFENGVPKNFSTSPSETTTPRTEESTTKTSATITTSTKQPVVEDNMVTTTVVPDMDNKDVGITETKIVDLAMTTPMQ